MKKKCRVYKPQSMQQGGQYDKMMAQDSLREQQRLKMFAEMSKETPVDSPALYIKDGKYIPVGTEFPEKRVSPMFIDPTATDIKPSYQEGGEPATTQDSNLDPVYKEKSNNFLNWLHQSSEKSKVNTMLKADAEAIDNGTFQIGGSINGSGYGTGDYGQMYNDTSAYENAYNNGKGSIAGDISTLAGLIPFNNKTEQPLNGETYAANADGSPIETIPTSFGIKPGGFGEGKLSAFMQTGGDVNYPGLDLIPEIDDSILQLPNEEIGNDYVLPPEPTEFVPGSSEDPFNKEKKRRSGNPYFAPQAINAATNVLTKIGEMDEQAKLEERLRRKQSDVHENFATFGSDRGDYMANTAGVGNFFRPDQHTRMGYNTKIAREGGEYNTNDEVELTEQQIRDLIAQGYDLEYLD